jgi:hypothetical protein
MHAIIAFVLLEPILYYVYTDSFEKQLFEHYSSIKKPRRNQSELVEVNISMTIKTVLKVDERFQYISFYAWFSVQWKDDFLIWNETEHPGTQIIKVPYQQVWIPDISLYYSESHIHDLGVHPFVSVSSRGYVTWFPGAMYTVQCHLKVQNFPFDEQKCNMVVGAWQTTDWTPKVVPQGGTKNAASEIAENGEWDFKEFTFSVAYNSEFALSQIVYTLVFKRRYLYFILSTIMPVIILAILNSLTFLIPAESGERITFCLTLFLTFTVFLTLFDQTMPRNSTDVPFITVFIAFHLFLCVISTIVSIFTISMKTNARSKVEPFKNSIDLLCFNGRPEDNDQREGSPGARQRTRRCEPRACYTADIVKNIDSIMLVMNCLFLGLSTLVLIVCYLS